MVSRDSLKLDLNFTLHGATNREVLVALHGLQDDLLLDEVLVLVRADPSGTGSQGGRVLLIVISLLNDVVTGVGAHDEECRAGLLRRGLAVSHLVEMVMHNLAQVDKSILLDLDGRVHVNLYARGVHNTQVTHEVLAILADNHELGLPQLLVVRDLVVVGLTFTHLEDALSAINGDLELLKLLSVDGLKFHVKLVSGGLIRLRIKCPTAEVKAGLELRGAQLTELDAFEISRVCEASKSRVLIDGETGGQRLNLVTTDIEFTLVGLNLVLKGVVSFTETDSYDILDEGADLFGVLGKTEDVVGVDSGLLVGKQVLLVVLGNLVELAELTDGSEEVISRDGSLALEEREPEDLGVLAGEGLHDLVGEVVVHDVLEINLVEVVGPGVQHGEALVLYALVTELLDVLLQELEVGLVGLHGVGEVVLVDAFLRVADEGADGLDAGAGLQVLGLNGEVEVVGDIVEAISANLLEDAHKHLLETLEVPVLVDAGVDDTGVEDLLGLHGE